VRKHDGDRLRCPFRSQGGHCSYRNDHVHLETDKFSCQLGEPIKSSVRRPVVNDEVPALDPAELTQRLSEHFDAECFGRVGTEIADPGRLLGLLRCERHREDAKGEDEGEPNNSVPHRKFLPW
jgi:hypothetical protein